MNEILIIIDGILAKHFLERLCFEKNLEYFLTIVSKEPLKISGENINLHCFDSTSKPRMAEIMSDFKQAFIYMQDEFDAKKSYEILRELDANLDIVMMDFWGFGADDKYLSVVDAKATLSKRLLDFLPNVAKTAQYIGLGVGEIMDVKIPEGSVFAYRHISSITQKRWRIAMVYRNQKIHFIKPSFVLEPNDRILIVGDPAVLLNIFHMIKASSGQFPMPFGNNIFTLIDMKNMSENEQNKLLETTLLMSEKTRAKKFFIYVLNANLSKTYFKLKDLALNYDNIYFDYANFYINDFENLIKDKDIGLFITENKYFESYKNEFFKLKIPILKIGKEKFESLRESVILSADESELENNANVIVDLSKQLKFDASFYYYNPGAKLINEATEYLSSLAKLHNKNVKIINKSDINPLLILEHKSDLLHFVSFDESLLKSKIGASFNTNLNTHYYKMSKNYQIFMPIS